MPRQIIPVQPFDYVVFGATGDLSRRKLLPALFHRFCDGQFDHNSCIVGVSRSKMDDNAFRTLAQKALEEFIPNSERPGKKVDAFLKCLTYVSNDVTDKKGWAELGDSLREDERAVRAFYLSVAPSLFSPVCDYLAQRNYWTPDARVVLEKPLGHDQASSNAINETVGRVFNEDQIYRIDHYLGKETVQNLLALRFANAMFEPLWNSSHIDHVQISVTETVGVEGREYYDDAGALRDMVQNHLLQLLCLVAMEPPATGDANALRDEKLKILRALDPINATNIDQNSVRGQYIGINAGEVALPGYVDEMSDTRKDSVTETFVALKAHIHNWRWAGVPFYLRTGKRLAKRASEIVIQFRNVPHSIFPETENSMQPNRLVLRLQPDEGVKMFLMIKDPGPGGMRLRSVPLNLAFADTFSQRTPEAYERLLMDVIRGNQTLFMRRDELDAAWTWIDPIRSAWQEKQTAPDEYTAGTWGPTSSIALIERDKRTWYEGAGE